MAFLAPDPVRLSAFGRGVVFPAALAGLLLLAGGGDARADGSRVALVIGNSAYESLDVLPGATADAAAVADALRELDFEVIELADGTNGEMSASLQDFSERLKPGAIALFYFAGHAIQFQGRNFLLPASASLTSDFAVLTEGIVANTVLGVMEKSDAALTLLFLDAAYRNRFVAESESLAPGLAKMESGSPETVIVFAAGPGEVVEAGEVPESPFAEALVSGLSRPVVEVNRLLAELQARVSTTTAGAQRPWMSVARVDETHLRAPEPLAEAPVAATVETLAEAPAGTTVAAGIEAALEDAPASAAPADAVEAASAPLLSAKDEAAQTGDAGAPEETAAATADPEDAAPETATESAAVGPDGTREAPAEPAAPGPTGHLAELQAIENALAAEDRKRIQTWLAGEGYYRQAVDGVFGPGTRRAIRAYQTAVGAEPTGWLTVLQLYRILRES